MSTSTRPIGFGDARVGAATLAAGLLVAQQVAGKALRDTLFLAEFGVEKLPYAMLASAVASGALIVTLSRVARVRSPRRVVSASLLASAGLFALGWLLHGSYSGASALITYLHTGSLTAATVSVFWVVVTQTFDPYVARGAVPRILVGATFGGALGGFVTWRMAGLSTPSDLLLLGTGLSVASWAFVRRLDAGPRAPQSAPERIGWRDFAPELSYLRGIAALVAVTAASQVILDYLLSAAALSSFGRGPELLSFFALFQSGVGLLSLTFQLSVSRSMLEQLGVGRVLLVAPLALLLGALTPLFAAPLAVAVLLRGADGALGGSLQRSAYEVLFAPLEEVKRRVSKPVLDVGVDRLGSLVGGALVLGANALGGVLATRALLALAVALALARALLAPLLQAGYRRILADNLRHGRLALSNASVLDPVTLGLLSLDAALPGRETLRQEVERFRAARAERSPLSAGGELSLAAFNLPAGPQLALEQLLPAEDAIVRAMRELRSGQPDRVRAALAQRCSEPVLVSQVIALLGDDRFARDAADWLSAQQPPPVGLYGDALLADWLTPAARRRVARLLGKLDSEQAVQCLVGVLPRVPPNVRSGVAQALARLATRRPIARAPLFAAIIQAASEPSVADEPLGSIVALLTATYPQEPIQPAFRALDRDDDLRGTALEWLDVLLPQEVKQALWPRLERKGERPPSVSRTLEQLRVALSAKALDAPDADADG